MEEGVPIESKMISKRIEGAQKAFESAGNCLALPA